MPWKISNADFEPGNPFVRFTDPTVDLHMVTSLATGIVEVFIGSGDPTLSRLFVRVHDDGVDVLRVASPTRKDLVIIDSVLRTLRVSDRARQVALGRLFEEEREAFQARA